MESHRPSASEKHRQKEHRENILLKLFFIFATAIYGITLFIQGVNPVISFLTFVIAGPLWNVVDGFGLFIKKSGTSSEEKRHGLFDYIALGVAVMGTIILWNL